MQIRRFVFVAQETAVVDQRAWVATPGVPGIPVNPAVPSVQLLQWLPPPVAGQDVPAPAVRPVQYPAALLKKVTVLQGLELAGPRPLESVWNEVPPPRAVPDLAK